MRMRGLGCVVGGLFDVILERGDSKLFEMLSPGLWVGCLKKWRTCWTSAAARVVRAGGNGVEMVECVVWGVLGGCLISFWEDGTPPGLWVGYLEK
jgi:hypothetical protein